MVYQQVSGWPYNTYKLFTELGLNDVCNGFRGNETENIFIYTKWLYQQLSNEKNANNLLSSSPNYMDAKLVDFTYFHIKLFKWGKEKITLIVIILFFFRGGGRHSKEYVASISLIIKKKKTFDTIYVHVPIYINYNKINLY